MRVRYKRYGLLKSGWSLHLLHAIMCMYRACICRYSVVFGGHMESKTKEVLESCEKFHEKLVNNGSGNAKQKNTV